jgi:hypothetical protein
MAGGGPMGPVMVLSKFDVRGEGRYGLLSMGGGNNHHDDKTTIGCVSFCQWAVLVIVNFVGWLVGLSSTFGLLHLTRFGSLFGCANDKNDVVHLPSFSNLLFETMDLQ